MRSSTVIYLLLLFITQQLQAQSLPYKSKNIYFSNADSSIRFGGTLTIPAGKKQHPVILLISGTGKQDRDGTMAGHPMFLTLADSLSRRGFAVLRVDDRGVGETTGIYEDATTQDFADDALSAIGFLKTQPEIDNKRIGLMGHSEGGAVAIITAAGSADVCFVITLAGLALRGLDALKLQNHSIVHAAPLSDYDKRRYDAINTLMFDTVYHYAGSPELEARIRQTHASWKKADDSAFVKDNPGKYDHMRFFLESYIKQATGKWYLYHIRFDPALYLLRIKIPFLALNGDKDLMVPAGENLGAIAEGLKKAGNKNVTIKVLPGINHLFQHCVTCTQQEPFTLKENFSAAAFVIIEKWLQQFAK